VRGLADADSLTIVGDLCDFWMAARLPETELLQCEGLQALAGFRARGGTLQIMAGNHDLWLCPIYERVLGAEILAEPVNLTALGLRVHLVHGHLLGARRRWKSLLESHQFFTTFGHVPLPVASILDQVLEWKNQRGLKADEERHLRVFREYAASLRGRCDLVVIGHVHRAVDDRGSDPRLIVLGGWQYQSSHLKIDHDEVSFQVVGLPIPEHADARSVSREPSSSEPKCASS
jgi:UDP-2,3-diacylglucosamine hydrolase